MATPAPSRSLATTFNTMTEAITKLHTGQFDFDIFVPTVDVLGNLVESKLIRPLNHSYIPNMANTWPDYRDPFYDQQWQYTTPYSIYTTGMAWRKDKVNLTPGWDMPWHASQYKGKVAVLDEQQFLVSTINRLERSPFWHDTAVIIMYDDSDGWYDHQMSPIVNQSQDPGQDALSGASCGTKLSNDSGTYQDRCGYGPRQPLLLISPYAKSNFVDHSITDQTSVLRFVEDNWQLGRIGDFSFDTKAGSLLNMFSFPPNGPVGGPNKLFIDPVTGEKGP